MTFVGLPNLVKYLKPQPSYCDFDLELELDLDLSKVNTEM